ncbi:MAG TPA: restriction endonuclease, partial [Flavisolibacter sp.]|nr:restriction endonuclease [Flavisolibacter sp.]
KFGILTNGIVYRFYTDLVEANKMDEKPFFEFRIDDIKDAQVEKLKEFHKSYFNLESIINTASELKFMSELRARIVHEISEPSDDFTRYFAKSVYPTVVTAKVLEQFRGLVKRSFHQYINDAINERLKSALATDQQRQQEIEKEDLTAATTVATEESRIQTTAEELEAFYIVRAILCSKFNVSRITQRDQQTYFGVLLDDNNRKPICRLHFNGKKKYVTFFDTGKEEKVEIQDNNQLYEFASRLIKGAEQYDKVVLKAPIDELG